FRSLNSEDYKHILPNLELHYQDFLRESQDSHMFGPDDRIQIEREYKLTVQHYEKLQRSLERGEQDELSCKKYVTQLKDIRLQLEGCEKRTIHKIRQPLDKNPLAECKQRINEQQKIHSELEGIKKNLNIVTEKTEKVLALPEQLNSAPLLRSELDITVQKMNRVYSLSAVYLEKLKTIDVVIRSTQEAEDLVKKYETRLREVNTVPADTKSLETYKQQLKGMRGEVGGNQPLFDNLESELSKAKLVNEQMIHSHSERDVDLDRYRECVQQLLEHWQGIQAQIDIRSRELEQLGRQLSYYREAHDWLIQWIQETKERQEKIQAKPIRNSSQLREQLQQEKVTGTIPGHGEPRA
ncbi:plectin-like, partial [Cetorhinus maximus]